MRTVKLASVITFLCLSCGLQAQIGGGPGPAPPGPSEPVTLLNIVPTQPSIMTVDHHVTYYGGKVIPNVRVYQVLWGTSGTFLPQVTGPEMGNFYREITRSAHFAFLSEYSTRGVIPPDGFPGSNQDIGAGTFNGQIVIQPAPANDTAIVTETQIINELQSQIASGGLPSPDDNTLYMVQFPAEKTISLTTHGMKYEGCASICGYHYTTKYNGQNVYFGVIPSCEICGQGESSFAKQTIAASHELFEAVTDAEYGNHDGPVGRPLAWMEGSTGEEIGDICGGTHDSLMGQDGVVYRVQQEFSNLNASCILIPPAGNDFSISLSPNSRTVTAGNATSYTVTTLTTSGSPQTITLSVSGCPGSSDATCTLSASSIVTGQSATLNVTTRASAAAGTSTLTVLGTGSVVRTAAADLIIQTAPPPVPTSVSPTAGSTAGGTSVQITGSGFQPGMTVTFGGVPAVTPTFFTATQITVVTGAHAAGLVAVTLTNLDGKSATLPNAFTYFGVPAPSVASPNVGPVGQTVIITGTSFYQTVDVTFGGAHAFYSIDSLTQITAIAPSHVPGPVDIIVTNTMGSGAPVGYTYTLPVDDATVITTSGIPSSMTPGQTAAVSVTMRNSGTTTWTAATNYKLGDAAPTGGLFGPTRVPVGADVPPGGQATFNFTLTAPTTPGTYTFGWRMLQEMVRWFGAYAPYGGYSITVAAPVDDAVVVTTSGIPSSMTPGQTAAVSVTMRNTGTTTWVAATGYKLGDAAPTGGLFGPARVPVGADVPPGGQATFNFTLTAPTTPGTYTFGWRMLQEMVRWFGAYAPYGGYSITVAAPALPVVSVIWLQPGYMAGFGGINNLVIAGRVTNVPAGTSVSVGYYQWSTGPWLSAPDTTTDASGIWYTYISNANFADNYSVFAVSSGVQSPACWTGPDANRYISCP